MGESELGSCLPLSPTIASLHPDSHWSATYRQDSFTHQAVEELPNKPQCVEAIEKYMARRVSETADEKKRETKTDRRRVCVCVCVCVCVWGGGLAPSVRYSHKDRKWMEEEIHEVDFLWQRRGSGSKSSWSRMKQMAEQR